MVADAERDQDDEQGRRVVFAASALPALDGLRPDERAAVVTALADVARSPGAAAAAHRLTRLDVPGETDLYVLRPSNRLWLVLRLAPEGAGEVVEIVRPETVRRLLATATTRQA
jgi:hypothetical protein